MIRDMYTVFLFFEALYILWTKLKQERNEKKKLLNQPVAFVEVYNDYTIMKTHRVTTFLTQ